MGSPDEHSRTLAECKQLLEEVRERTAQVSAALQEADGARGRFEVALAAFQKAEHAGEQRALMTIGAALLSPIRSILGRVPGMNMEDLDPILADLVHEVVRNQIASMHPPVRFLAQVARASELLDRPGPRALSPPGTRSGRLRILYVTGLFPSNLHGGGLRIQDILLELSRRHEVDLYSAYVDQTDRASLEALEGSLGAIRLNWGVDLVPSDIVAWIRRRGLQANAYEVIQFEYPLSSRAMRALRPYGRRLGFTMMESVSRRFALDLMRFQGRNTAAAAAALIGLVESILEEGEALRQADFSVAVTDSDESFAQRLFGVPSHIVPTGISPEFIVPDDVSPTRRRSPVPVLFVGYFDHYPNLDGIRWYLREVHPHVKTNAPGHPLLVVGAGGAGELEKLREEYRSDPSVRIMGAVEKLSPVIREAGVCIAPLISGAGIRGKIHQYSALGRPTVATRLAASGTLYREGESILLADDARDFAEAVVALLKDVHRRRRQGAEARQVVLREYQWPALIRRLETIYAPKPTEPGPVAVSASPVSGRPRREAALAIHPGPARI